MDTFKKTRVKVDFFEGESGTPVSTATFFIDKPADLADVQHDVAVHVADEHESVQMVGDDDRG